MKPLHIDIPVKLEEVKIAFNIAGLAFEGDLPASVFHLQLIAKDIADWNAKAQVIAVFNTNAGHPTLNDEAYNAERNVKTGNPYKSLITDLMSRGVHIEMCGATAAAHGWGNVDFIPESRSTQMPWREWHSSHRKDSWKSPNGTNSSPA